MKQGAMKRRMRTLVWAGVVAALTILGIPSSAQAEVDVAGWEFKDMSAHGISVPMTFDLAFDEERVAWVRVVDGRPDIYLTDLKSGAETQLTDSTAWKRVVALEGEQVAWIEYAGSDWLSDSTIWLKDLTSEEPARALVTAKVALDSRLVLAGDYLAWVQYDPYPGGAGVRPALYLQHVNTGAVVRISDTIITGVNSNEGDKAFDLTTTHLAYVEQVPEEDARVMLYDLAAGERQELGRVPRATEHVDLEGDLLTWSQADETADHEHANTRIFIHRPSTGETTLVASAPIFRTYPKTDGRFVVWEQERRPAVPPLPFPLVEIWAYEADTEPLSDVSQNEFLNFTPEISAGLVVWERGGELESEIMARDLLTGQTTQLSSNRVWMDQLALVNNRTVVWWKHWSSMEVGVPEPEDRFMMATAPASFVDPFADVPGQHRFRTAILAMDELGIATGYPATEGREFRPEEPLLRAQFAKMICEAFDLPVTEDMTSAFTDMGADDPANLYPHEYVAALTASGVIKGKTAAIFDPYAPVTHAQAATLLVRALDAFEPGLLKNISGQAPGAYYWEPPHLDNLRKAYANDLLSSTIDWLQRWDARTACSRGEAAQMLWNALELRD